MSPNDCRMPPQNLVAERSLLGSLLLDSRMLDGVLPLLDASGFYSDIHGAIFRSIVATHERDGSVDVVTLAGQLESQGTLEEIGGPPYLMEILETVPNAAHAVYYANLVVGCARRRRAIEIGRKLVESSYNPACDHEELAAAALIASAALSEHVAGTATKRTLPLSDHVETLISNLEAGIMPSHYDGVELIDQLIQGTADGELIVIAAATSNGKSLLGLQWLHAASRHMQPGLMISEEMAAISLASRTLSTISCIPSEQWMNETSRLRFDSKEHFSSCSPILVAEKCGSVASAEREIAEAVQKAGAKVVAVDYAQMLRGDGFNKQERVADVSGRMKGAAMKHGIRVILLAQLNRDIDKRDDSTPQLSDIRDSAAIAMDADVVLMPYWPYVFDKTYADPTEYRIYCRKNRNRGIREECVKMRINCPRQQIEPWLPPVESGF